MQVGDIIRVEKQPQDLMPKIVGERGFIQEIQGDYASILTLRLNGDPGGGGCVPLACLALETDARWLEAKAVREAYVAKLVADSKAFSLKLEGQKQELADRYGITTEAVTDIHDTIAKLYP